VAVGVAAAWEVVENTPMVIERYRTVTMSLDYMGDSIANSVGDVAACMLGFVIAKWAGWKWAMGIFVVTEIALLFVMRDNLTLNVLMLFWPIEAVKQWQSVH
jgi:predicted MFS family arabinose efflux permease